MAANNTNTRDPADVYGPWADNTPVDAAKLFADYPGTWWITGGWVLEAFTGVARKHGDVDLSVLRCDLPLLRRHLSARFDVWTATNGALCPLFPNDEPDGNADDVLPDECEQVWTRRSGADPWEYDIMLAPGDPDIWVYKRDPSMRMPLANALWERDGVPYLRPEIQLLYKARGLREKDQADFTATVPYLGSAERAWLRTSLEQTLPGHRWIGQL